LPLPAPHLRHDWGKIHKYDWSSNDLSVFRIVTSTDVATSLLPANHFFGQHPCKNHCQRFGLHAVGIADLARFKICLIWIDSSHAGESCSNVGGACCHTYGPDIFICRAERDGKPAVVGAEPVFRQIPTDRPKRMACPKWLLTDGATCHTNGTATDIGEAFVRGQMSIVVHEGAFEVHTARQQRGPA
jgi:hypothetical protein